MSTGHSPLRGAFVHVHASAQAHVSLGCQRSQAEKRCPIYMQGDFLTTSISNINHVSCNGGNDGQATVNVVGGSPGYTFSWSPAAGNSQTALGLTVGNYTVTVLDSNGCSAIANVVINEPTAPLSVTSSQTNVSCFGAADGSATVTASGGVVPYTYAWSNLSTSSSISGFVGVRIS